VKKGWVGRSHLHNILQVPGVKRVFYGWNNKSSECFLPAAAGATNASSQVASTTITTLNLLRT